MKRVAVAGASLVALAAMGACADTRAVSSPRPLQTGGNAQDMDSDKQDKGGDPTVGRTGPLADGGASSCVRSYAAKAVGELGFAFDGVVVEFGASVSDRGDDADLGLAGVTFEVREWFSGGQGETVTVDMQHPSEDALVSNADYAYGVGSRLLISGQPRWGGPPLQQPIAWGCGFSRYHDPATATAWREALAR